MTDSTLADTETEVLAHRIRYNVRTIYDMRTVVCVGEYCPFCPAASPHVDPCEGA